MECVVSRKVLTKIEVQVACVCVCVLYYMEAFCFIVVKEPLTNSRHPCHVGHGTTSAPLLTQELFLVGAVQWGLMSLLWKTVSTGIHTRDMCCWVGWPRPDTKAAAPCGSVKGFWEGLLYINVVLFFFFWTVETHNLHSLHTILSTGSPLKPQSYDYVYRCIKNHVLLGSISGDAEIQSLCSSFVEVWKLPSYL